jgi:hypothetical protein
MRTAGRCSAAAGTRGARIEPGPVWIIGAIGPRSPAIDCMQGGLPAKFEEAAILAGLPHLPRDACSEASGLSLGGDAGQRTADRVSLAREI